MDTATLFELELVRRGMPFTMDPSSGRHLITLAGNRMAVDLGNLHRELTGGTDDLGIVSQFVDAVVASSISPHDRAIEDFYWCLERNNYADPPPYAHVVSAQLDRVLSRFVNGQQLLAWATPSDMGNMAENGHDPAERAWANLDEALKLARLSTQELDGTTVAYFETDFVCKASLMLAPTLQDIVGAAIGWPVLAVAPARDFQVLWNADQTDIIPRLGPVISREYSGSPYPLSTEVFRISDTIESIGAFEM